MTDPVGTPGRPAAPLTQRSSRVVSAVKLHRAVERRRRGLFLAEGVNAVSAAIQAGGPGGADPPVCVDLLCTRESLERYREIGGAARAAGLRPRLITASAAERLAETVTSQGMFAVCRLLDVPLADVVAGGKSVQAPSSRLGAAPSLLAVPVAVSDPGNAGTILRVSDAMGLDAVVFAGEGVDPHNGKCVRASAGSVFHVPFARERDTAGALAAVRAAGMQVLATAADGEVDLDDADELLARPAAWLFGNEAHGLDPAVAAGADHRVRIPIAGRAESLNLATAAAICLHAGARAQRRGAARDGAGAPPACGRGSIP